MAKRVWKVLVGRDQKLESNKLDFHANSMWTCCPPQLLRYQNCFKSLQTNKIVCLFMVIFEKNARHCLQRKKKKKHLTVQSNKQVKCCLPPSYEQLFRTKLYKRNFQLVTVSVSLCSSYLQNSNFKLISFKLKPRERERERERENGAGDCGAKQVHKRLLYKQFDPSPSPTFLLHSPLSNCPR